ncbi:PAS domain-containing protein [Brevundimonas sp.]
MFHADTHLLIDHWTTLSRAPSAMGGIPNRNSLHPDALGLRMPRLFMAEIMGDAPLLRVCGEWIESFHGLSLKDQPLLALWRETSHTMIAAALQQCIQEARPVVIKAAVGLSGDLIEVTLAPLRGASGQIDRIVGLYTALSTLALGQADSRLLTGRVCIGVGPTRRVPLSLAAVHGRRIA